MSRIYKNLIIVVSVLVVVCFAAVMFALYGKDDKKTNAADTTTAISFYLDDMAEASENISESNDLTPDGDKNIKSLTTSTVSSESDASNKNDETANDESVEIKILTSEEKYKASSNFVKVQNREKKDVFCFVGDVFLSKKPRAAYDEKGIDGIIDEGYLKILKGSDFNIANLECSITDDIENAADKTFTFALPTKYLEPIKEIGINLFTLANNHVLDYGVSAMQNTMKVLKDNDILYIGAGNNIQDAKRAHIKEIDGKRYAFLGASAVLPADSWKATDSGAGVFNGYDIRELCEEIKEVKPYVDKVIVYMHWGRELETVSNTWQKQYARRIVDAGADLVVGSHPHMVQEIEYYKNVPIVYSLGNFIYGGTMRDTILLSATFDYSIDKNGQLQLIIYPGISSYERVKRDWKKDEIAAKIKEIQDKSGTCYIGDNGYVFTMEQVTEALKNIANK